VLCRICFNDHNGDGIDAVGWLIGWNFPATLKEMGDRLIGNGQPIPKTTPRTPKAPKPDPAEKIELQPWSGEVASQWAQRKPPISTTAIREAGGEIVWYKYQNHRYVCLSYPTYRTKSDQKRPCGYQLFAHSGLFLPSVSGDVKNKNTPGSVGGGFIGEWGLDHLDGCEVVWKVEGVTDLLALMSAIPPDLKEKHVVLTNSCGTNETVSEQQKEMLTNKAIYMVHDADNPGRAGATKQSESYNEVAAEVRVLNLDEVLDGDDEKAVDIRDYLLQGGDFAGLVELAASTQPMVRPEIPPVVEDTSNFSNSTLVESVGENGKTKMITDPTPLLTIADQLAKRTDSWPRRVSGELFIDNGGQITWLDKQPGLFAYMQSKMGVVYWRNSVGCVTKDELFRHLRANSKTYQAIEHLPHVPPIKNHYYTCTTPPPGSGDALTKLVEFFSPETDTDKELIYALFVTAFWGGGGGTRPAFVITSDAGRGAGKSKLTEILSYLVGGHIDLTPNENIEDMKKRLLSNEAHEMRIVRLDNVKRSEFSWGEFESLVTAPTISGRKLWAGESQRPNNLMWIITLNGVSLSTDMAQRSVIIKLKLPTYSGDWEDNVRGFIDSHRAEIIADIVGFFALPSQELTTQTRWAQWGKAVLTKFDRPDQIQDAITLRSREADADDCVADIISDYFRQRLDHYGFGEKEQIHIPSRIVCQWYYEATSDKKHVKQTTQKIKQFSTEGTMKNIKINPSKKHTRGFIWTDEGAEKEPINYDLETRITSQSQWKSY